MNLADITILVFLFLWGAVAVRSIFRRKGCGGCQGCNGDCMSGNCPNAGGKKGKQPTDKYNE